jgi:hypothetical protein
LRYTETGRSSNSCGLDEQAAAERRVDLAGGCSSQAGARGLNENGVFNDGPSPAPWQTSFEDGFCSYEYQAGLCFSDQDSDYRIVTSPVRSLNGARNWNFFHFDLKRSADQAGEVALFQDGAELVRETGLITDDSPVAQWYVGNWASALTGTTSTTTVYVDDVTVRLP